MTLRQLPQDFDEEALFDCIFKDIQVFLFSFIFNNTGNKITLSSRFQIFNFFSTFFLGSQINR